MLKMVHQFWRKIQRFWNAEIPRTVYATAAAHSNFISVGITQGFSAVMLPQLDVSHDQSSWIAGLGVISTPLGALLSGVLVDLMGRRQVLLLPNLFFFISWIIIGLGPSIPLLYLGRALGGLAAGMATSSYLYVCEISRVDHRGVLSAMGPVFVSIGILMVYTLGFLFDWQKVALIASLVCFVSVMLIYAVPDSPAWYVSMDQPDKALASLHWLRRDSKVAEKELQSLLDDFNHKHKQDCQHDQTQTSLLKQVVTKLKHVWLTFSQPQVYKPFLILVAFFFFQEGSGIYIFLFYSVQIFQEFGTNYDEHVVTITIGVMRLVMAILGAILMSKFGRRQLSIFSGSCMSLALFTVSLYLIFVPLLEHPIHILPVMCVFSHVGFSMTGFLQIPFILSSELFPVRCRGVMGGISCSLGYVLIFVSVKMYPAMLAWIEIQGVLWSFFCVTAAGVVFLLLFLPETKDKSFEEISNSFSKKIPNDKTKELV